MSKLALLQQMLEITTTMADRARQFAVAMLAASDPAIARKLAAFRVRQTTTARAMRVPPEPKPT